MTLLDLARDPHTGEVLWTLASLADEGGGVEQYRLWTPEQSTVFDVDGVQIEQTNNERK